VKAVDQVGLVLGLTARHACQRPKWDSDPTSRCASLPQAQCAGGSGSSTQSHWVSSGRVLDHATARPLVGTHGSHAGRKPPGPEGARVIVGYERS